MGINAKAPIQIDRRSFIKGTSVLLASTALFGFAGCAPAGTGKEGFAPGTYKASFSGKNGPIDIECVLSESAVDSVKVLNHYESKYISDIALERIPQEIVQNQTLEIDTVSGATATSQAILAATADCVDQAGRASSLTGAPLQKSTEAQTIEADLIVVGAGAAGIVAAVSAAQEGKNVVVIEAASNVGGNCLASGGAIEYIYAPDELKQDMNEGYAAELEKILSTPADTPKAQEIIDLANKEWADYQATGNTKVFDSEAFFAVHNFTFRGDPIEHNYHVAKSRVMVTNWLADLGMTFRPLMSIAGSMWPRWTGPAEGSRGQGYFELLLRVIDEQKLPVTILTETEATKLVEEGGRVVGVEARAANGTSYSVSSDLGVVLTPGGFSANLDLIKKYNTFWELSEVSSARTTNAAFHKGSGLDMALELGAKVSGCEKPQFFPLADVKTFSTQSITNAGSALLVNKEGKRFVNETLSRYDLVTAMLKQTGETSYMIGSANNSSAKDGKALGGVPLELLEEEGRVYVADTLEELAGKAGIDKANLLETVKKYNGYVEAFSDPDFGRTAFAEGSSINEPPYYLSPKVWATHITTGGLAVVDSFVDYRAVREDGSAIEGLFVAGEAREGFAGVGSLGDGLACARSITA